MHKSISKVNTTTALVTSVLAAAVALPAFAWNTPSDLREEDDRLLWSSDAPSYNIYEDGNYIATVHGTQSFGPLFDNSSYQVVAHNHGVEFTGLSAPFLFLDDEDGEDDEDDVEFDEFEIYLELNNTDGDLGIHSFLDGDEWTEVTYEDLNGRALIEIKLMGPMAEQGLTELFFESTEPTFDELNPVDFFARFPAGVYDVEGVLKNGTDIENEAILSHVLPAAPTLYLGVNPANSFEGCEDEDSANPMAFLDADGGLTITWDPVDSSHPTLGVPGEIEVDSYIIVYEGEDVDFSVEVDSDVTSFTVPASLVNSGDIAKIEVLVKDDTHNQVATEACAQII